MALGKWGDGDTWGHSAPNNFWNSPSETFTRREALIDWGHNPGLSGVIRRLSVKFTYINAVDLVPRLANLMAMVKVKKGQQLATHEALFDRDDISYISLSIQHSGGTDFVLSHTQLLAKLLKQRPRG